MAVSIFMHTPSFFLVASMWFQEPLLGYSLPGWVSTDQFCSGYTINAIPLQGLSSRHLCKGTELLVVTGSPSVSQAVIMKAVLQFTPNLVVL